MRWLDSQDERRSQSYSFVFKDDALLFRGKRRTTRDVFVSLQRRDGVHSRPVADNISRCITRWCYRRPARGGFAVNTIGPCLLERPFCPTASAAVVPRSAVIFRQMQTGVDGLASRTITIEHASVKADLNRCSFLSPLPPTFIFLCFPFNRPFLPSAVRFNVLAVLAFATMFCSPSLHLFLCLLSIVILILIIIISLP